MLVFSGVDMFILGAVWVTLGDFGCFEGSRLGMCEVWMCQMC